tara:strand:+ start:4374 stop:5093 length:720 start_codon:yes stop_codon:yes gene_type:complete
MLLGITEMPPCGFGNRLLYYYNLRQEAHKRGCNFFSIPWNGHEFFEGNMLGDYPPSNDEYESMQFCLGDKFYDSTQLSTRAVFQLKKKPSVMHGTCAIHFRGTDFYSWNSQAVLSYEYYYKSIEEVKDYVSQFAVFTDDRNLESFVRVKDKLNTEGFKVIEGQNTHDRKFYIEDFSYMTECDWIISSPSSFCVAAGFIGKHKKIIHCEQWIENRIEEKDKFWIDLYNGGNNDYFIWRLI